MKIAAEQLDATLRRDPLAPLYLIHGDEPLLALEAADRVRAAARDAGFGERIVFDAGAGIDWTAFHRETAGGSLFGDRRLIEIRFGGQKPDDAAKKTLARYLQAPAPDLLLLLQFGKLDAAAQRARWFLDLEKTGVSVPVWPLKPRQLPGWLQHRCRLRRVSLSADALTLLQLRVEGNLLAAAQEIDKLALLFGAAPIDAAALGAAVANSARHSVFDLADAALAGQPKRAVRILNTLRAEAAEPVLIQWSLNKEVRLLNDLHDDLKNGQPVAAALAGRGVWEQRKPLYRRALQRLDDGVCRALLNDCAALDRTLKGVPQEPPPAPLWDGLLALVSGFCGRRYATAAPAR